MRITTHRATRGFHILGLLAGLGIGTSYLRTLFVPYSSDDYHLLFNVREHLGGFPIASLFLPQVQGLVLPPFYRPIDVAAFAAVDRYLDGSVLVFHGLLIATRLITLYLVWLLGRRIFGDSTAAIASVLLYATSPWGIESLVWPTDLMDGTLVLFVLAAFLCFDRVSNGEPETPGARHPGWLLLACLFTALALASKEPAVLIPVFLVPLAARAGLRGVLATGAVASIVLAYLAMRWWMHLNVPQWHKWTDSAYANRIAEALDPTWWATYAADVGRLVVGPALPTALALLGLLILCGAWCALLRWGRSGSRPWLLLLALLILAPIAMTKGLTSPRYGFLPALGGCLTLAGFVGLCARHRPGIASGILGALVLFQLALINSWITQWQQTGTASDSLMEFLEQRPAEEETVVLHAPGFVQRPWLGHWQLGSYAVTDDVYPAWMKAYAGRGDRAVVLFFTDDLFRSEGGRLEDPVVVSLAECVVELRIEPSSLAPLSRSVLTSASPKRSRFLGGFSVGRGKVTVRLKAAEGRRFFTKTGDGWRELACGPTEPWKARGPAS